MGLDLRENKAEVYVLLPSLDGWIHHDWLSVFLAVLKGRNARFSSPAVPSQLVVRSLLRVAEQEWSAFPSIPSFNLQSASGIPAPTAI